MKPNLPLILAHRGDQTHAPENTLSAFEKAIQHGADGIELDVWQCASGEMVVTHDRYLTDQNGKQIDVQALSLSEIKKINIGDGENIPSLQESLKLTQKLTLLNIEIKGKNFSNCGVEAEILSCIQNLRLLRCTVISSFNPITLYRIKKLSPKAPTGLIFQKNSILPLRKAWAAPLIHPNFLHPEFCLYSQGLAEHAQRKNQKVIAWTINNIHDLEACIRLGVHAIITDDPLRLRQYLDTKLN